MIEKIFDVPLITDPQETWGDNLSFFHHSKEVNGTTADLPFIQLVLQCVRFVFPAITFVGYDYDGSESFTYTFYTDEQVKVTVNFQTSSILHPTIRTRVVVPYLFMFETHTGACNIFYVNLPTDNAEEPLAFKGGRQFTNTSKLLVCEWVRALLPLHVTQPGFVTHFQLEQSMQSLETQRTEEVDATSDFLKTEMEEQVEATKKMITSTYGKLERAIGDRLSLVSNSISDRLLAMANDIDTLSAHVFGVTESLATQGVRLIEQNNEWMDKCNLLEKQVAKGKEEIIQESREKMKVKRELQAKNIDITKAETMILQLEEKQTMFVNEIAQLEHKVNRAEEICFVWGLVLLFPLGLLIALFFPEVFVPVKF